jgi:hypothetical protein
MPTTDKETGPRYSKSPLRPYRYWSPRFWHGMQLGTWLRLLARNRFAVTPSRVPMAAGITLTCALNSCASVFDRLVLDYTRSRTKLAEPPLFVLGHWRSGTTLLHELLILDPEHTYPTTFECYVPHHFTWTEWWLPPLIAWLLPATRPMDNMRTSWDRPQEDEFALCNMGIPSPYLAWAFPNHGAVADEYLDLTALPDAERRRWKATWERFVRRVAAVRNRRVVLKSPTHTARVRTLLEVVPEARFIHIVRDPLVLFPSTVRLWRSLSEVQGMQRLPKDDGWIEEHVLETFVRMYDRFEQDRELVPPGHLVDVRYEELVADPVGQMRQVYDQLGLGDFARVEPEMRRYAKGMRAYRTNRYALPPDVAQRVRDRWASYFERYGYGSDVADAASA